MTKFKSLTLKRHYPYMAISFTSAPSYFWLNSWVLANIIELATQQFCDKYIDYKIDPGHRLYDQMTQAARSIRANIAEGSGRHETSFETEMKLTDVGRASVHELMGDFINYLMRFSLMAWESTSPKFQKVITTNLDKPSYGQNFIKDASCHIKSQKSKFDSFLENGSVEDAANCIIVLCLKINSMITKMLASQLTNFKNIGGFTENLTQTRIESKREQSKTSGAPSCPVCGKPMFRRTIQRGVRQGQQFWGCSAYPQCNGIINS
ncbi:MAG: four helix bundle protein [Muribaculum sp.]|nr:four helix bundle protein [Muribaculum sp.]